MPPPRGVPAPAGGRVGSVPQVPRAPYCPEPLIALAGRGPELKEGIPKGTAPHGRVPSEESHVGRADKASPAPRAPPHLSAPAGSALSSASGVSGAVPEDASGDTATSPGSPRPPRRDMARAGTERARTEPRQ